MHEMPRCRCRSMTCGARGEEAPDRGSGLSLGRSARGAATVPQPLDPPGADCGLLTIHHFLDRVLDKPGACAIVSRPQPALAGLPNPADLQRIWQSAASNCGVLIVAPAL